jgi:hypothetical protein
MGGFGGWLGKNGLDLALGAMSLFGGDDEGQKRQSYAGHGLSDPTASLNATLAAIQNLAKGWSSQPMQAPRPAISGRGMEPISVPGIPFQIGGGMGFDPSWLISLMQPQQGQTNPFDFSGNQARGGTQGARRRTPGGSE